MRLYSVLVFVFFFTAILSAINPDVNDGVHDSFDQLLRKHVDVNGKVDYKGFKQDESILDDYLSSLAKSKPNTSSTKNKQLAYWINLYNASTIKLILMNFPVSSITDISNGKPWDEKWILVGETKYSLNQIENEIIRPTFNEPRIHFAVNCAAKSCPPLMNRAWKGETMEKDLENMTSRFINNIDYNMIKSNEVKISKIFDWYKSDFGDLIRYINAYTSTKVNKEAKVTYHDYNWSLNIR